MYPIFTPFKLIINSVYLSSLLEIQCSRIDSAQFCYILDTYDPFLSIQLE